MSGSETQSERHVLRVSGKDRQGFLQGLVTNDVTKLSGGLVYAALLTPQGKYLADFFLVPDADAILIDVSTDIAAPLAKRLSLYRLRADVQIDAVDMPVRRGLGAAPDGGFADPRHPELGWRAYGPGGAAQDGASQNGVDWAAIRVAHTIPETGIELIPDETFPLEAGLDRLGGVDFRKGCYVGQEVTARMRHKTQLRKGLAQVEVEGAAAPGTPITAGGKAVGTLYTQSAGGGIAHLRYDRAGLDMQAGEARVRWRG